MNAIDRFMQYVEKSNSCWNWIGTKDHNGYGMFYLKGSGTRIASRISWILLVGEIPANACVLHKCDNPACVNPDHLYLGTHKQNTRDMMDRNRRYQPNVSGENNGRSKITRKDAEEIRTRSKNGVTTKQLIQDYGLCRTVIRYIIRGHLWKAN